MINLTSTRPERLIDALILIKGEQMMHGKVDNNVTISKVQADYLTANAHKSFEVGGVAGFNIYVEDIN